MLFRHETLTHFGLKQVPFQRINNLEDVFRTTDMKAIEDFLAYAIEQSAMVAIIGEVGSGKTNAIRNALWKLERRRNNKTKVVHIDHVNKNNMTPHTLYQAIGNALDLDHVSGGNRGAVQVKAAMIEHVLDGEKLIVHIDEAHRLKGKFLHSLKEMHEWNGKHFNSLFGVVLSGWPTLKNHYRTYARDVWQRLNSGNIIEMSGLAQPEVKKYINSRLQRVGAKREIFTPEACAIIARETMQPLKVNELATAMMIAAARYGKKTVTGNIALMVAQRRGADLKTLLLEAGINISELHRQVERTGLKVARSSLSQILNGSYKGNKETVRKVKDVITAILREQGVEERMDQTADSV